MANPFRKEVTAPAPAPKAVVASAVNISKTGVKAYHARKGNDTWQKEAWYQFDICGELRYATTWIANAISMASMYAAEIDPETGLVTDATENALVSGIANSILGGPANRAQAQSTIALNWQVAGEVFIVVRPSKPKNGVPQPDEWIVLSTTEIQEQGGSFKYEDPITGEFVSLNPSTDLIIRVWSPHPRKRSHADSAVRASLPTLREIEKTSQNIAARLDSRLIGNGLLFLPQEVDFPSNNTDQPGLVGFMDEVTEAAQMSLSNPGQASAQVPIMLQIPGEQVGNVQHMDLSTKLDSEILDLRTAAIRRLALSLDMPAEVMLGMGDSNHWSAWQIEESAYKIHVAPLLDRLADALTTEYLHPALTAAGVQDVDRYVLAFDTTEIISRPNRFQELTELHDRVLISDEYLRAQSGIPDDAVPDDDERNRRFFQGIVTSAPTIIIDVPQIATAIGLNPAEAAQEAAGGERAVEASPTTETNALPERSQDDSEGSVQASAGVPLAPLVSAAELIVFDALSRAGGRLLTRSYRGQFQHTAKFDLHTVIPFDASPQGCERLLEGSFQFVDRVADGFGIDRHRLMSTVRTYVENLFINRESHNADSLRENLWQMIR